MLNLVLFSVAYIYFIAVDPKVNSMLAPSAHSPTIVFQVFSTDWLGRHKLEGYGYHHLSDQPGSHDLEVRTWRPVGKIRDQMQDFFLGNAAYLKDEHFVDSVNKTASALNRFGVLTHSSGSVRIRVHTVVTDPRSVDLHHKETAEQQQAQDSSLKVKRTVNDILQSFRTSISGTPRKMMSASNSASGIGIAALSNPGTPNSSMRPSVSNILNSLNVSARDAKLNDILARARAKTGKGGANAEGKPVRAGNANADSKFSSGSTTQARGIAAIERLHSQLPDSGFNEPTPAMSPKNRQFNAPATPSGQIQTSSTIDTPYANAPYDPYIEKSTPAAKRESTGESKRDRSTKVPPLNPVGGAHAVTPAGALAPLTGSASRGKLQPLGGASEAGSAASSAPGTARGAPSAIGAVEHAPSSARDVSAPSTASAAATPAASSDAPVLSAPNTARRAHRYDTNLAASEDEAEVSESLLGDLPPRLQALNMRGNASASADTVLSEDAFNSTLRDDDDQAEDTPLMGTLTR